jgi:predicted ATP-binding protein involved in virulence
VYLSAERNKLVVPKSIEPVDVMGKTVITRNASKEFLKYILSLDYQLYGAKTNKDIRLEANLEKWFDNFQQALREIYRCPELKLQRDTKNLVFKVDMPGREPFGLHEMSDGYAAFLDIFMELLMRLENAETTVEYEQPAIVLIDEIETHLHVELQKRALPFLAKMFPHIQFITATHSPFVITLLSNSVTPAIWRSCSIWRRMNGLKTRVSIPMKQLSNHSWTRICTRNS